MIRDNCQKNKMKNNSHVMNIREERCCAGPSKLEFVKNVMSYILDIMSVLYRFNERSI